MDFVAISSACIDVSLSTEHLVCLSSSLTVVDRVPYLKNVLVLCCRGIIAVDGLELFAV